MYVTNNIIALNNKGSGSQSVFLFFGFRPLVIALRTGGMNEILVRIFNHKFSVNMVGLRHIHV